MAAMTATMLMAWLVLVAAPRTRIGATLRRMLVIVPAERLSRAGTGTLVLAAMLALAAAGAAWLLQDEAIRLLAMATPEVAVWIGAFEVTTWLDAAIAVLAGSATLDRRAVTRRVRPRMPMRIGARRRRARSSRPVPPSANDDERPGRVAAA